jgi:hypothetical protein
MPTTEVTEPPSAREAFERTDQAAVLTQAAVLLILGLQLRGTATTQFQDVVPDILPEDDLAVLQIPPLSPLGGRIDSQRARIFLASRFGTSVAAPFPEGEDVTWRSDIFAELARDHLRQPTANSATNLMEACLRHPHEIVRVAAAAAYHDWSSERPKLTTILEEGTRSADLSVRQLAATALAQVHPDNARLRDLTRSAGRAAGAAGAASHTAMLVHGTFALGATWWQPGGHFHSYLLQVLRPDLYKNYDRFSWSGAYGPDARELGADDLLIWVNNHNEQGLDLFTHSHGGNLAMLATTKGLQIGELVLLSCPVHVPKYLPDFNRVGKVVSIRVRLDLIILADRGGQRFKHPKIQENILPIWFSHAVTHKPEVWKNNTYAIPAML